jgi:hypothetical protein
MPERKTENKCLLYCAILLSVGYLNDKARILDFTFMVFFLATHHTIQREAPAAPLCVAWQTHSKNRSNSGKDHA